MKNTIFIFFIFIFHSTNACNCLTFKEAQKKSIASNKFILLHFGNSFYADDNNKGYLKMSDDNENNRFLSDNYIYVCVYKSESPEIYSNYKIEFSPQLLVVDANANEIIRFSEKNTNIEIVNALKNFTIPINFFASEFKSYQIKQGYSTALRLALKYFDYSFLIDFNLKKNVFKIAETYLIEAEKELSKKDEKFIEKIQKIQLFKLYHWAYNKNLDVLNEKLALIKPDSIHEDNIMIYYFLKYASAKALQTDNFSEIEKQVNQMEGFEYYKQKADLIININYN